MLKAAVNVADHFIRFDLASRSTVQIGYGGLRNLQTLKLLLGDRVSHGSFVPLSILLGKGRHANSSYRITRPDA
jgi:hypothetical protein